MRVQRKSKAFQAGLLRVRQLLAQAHRIVLKNGLGMDRWIKVPFRLNAALFEMLVHLITAPARALADEQDEIIAAGRPVVREMLNLASRQPPQAVTIGADAFGPCLHQLMDL